MSLAAVRAVSSDAPDGRSGEKTGMRFAAVTLGVIATSVALGLLTRSELPERGRDMRSSSTPAAGGLEIRRLTRVAERGGRSGTTITRRVGGRTWHIEYSSSDRRICWVLVIPGGHPDGTCGTRTRIRKSAFTAYAGQLGGERSARDGAAVIWGWVWPQVDAMRVLLSDCSSLRVDLSTRPIFWRFVPTAKLRKNVHPARVEGLLTNGRHAWRLLDRESSSKC
jgi:hypothetical protein